MKRITFAVAMGLLAAGCVPLCSRPVEISMVAWHNGQQVMEYRERGGALSNVGERDLQMAFAADDTATSGTMRAVRTKQTLGGMWSGAMGVIAGWIGRGVLP